MLFYFFCFQPCYIYYLDILLKSNFSVYGISGNAPYLNLLLLISFPEQPCMPDRIYLSSTWQIVPNTSIWLIYFYTSAHFYYYFRYWQGKGIYGQFMVCYYITGVRWVWLIIMLRRYAEWKISPEFIREHMKLGMPLIITTLISGSAQYIDGVIVSAYFDDPKDVCNFPIWSKGVSTCIAAGQWIEQCNAYQILEPDQK